LFNNINKNAPGFREENFDKYGGKKKYLKTTRKTRKSIFYCIILGKDIQ
jgi:hypothetical protein